MLNKLLSVQVRQAAGLRAEKASLRELAYGASGIIRFFCLSNIEKCNLVLSLLQRRAAKRRFSDSQPRCLPHLYTRVIALQ